ncbi:MAG: VanZ family protein [Methylococcaceae bacterium NSP1-2]|nr:VanZ family protein [Methylococcaceae bacterium]OYV20843.1 MAG: VanZ family protein [Methylococcaceae bacterium NSP1-2]
MVRVVDFLALLLYCALIYWLSDQQTLPTPDLFDSEDKLIHFGAYFVMGLFAWRSFKHLISMPIILALLSIVFCSLYGASDEWHQSFVIGRVSDAVDWLADTSGAIVGVFLLHKLRKSRQFQ